MAKENQEALPYRTVGSNVRIEPGPALKRATASPETLDNSVTAPHYQVGERDAMGRAIREGEEFHFLDYNAGEDGRVWYVYQEQEVPVLDAAGNPINGEDGNPQTEMRWVEIDVYKTEEGAENAAKRLAGR